MILKMDSNPKKQKMYVRVTPAARHALKTLLVAMQSPTLFPELTQEDFVGATWLWLAELESSDVAEGIRPHLMKIRAYWEEVERKGIVSKASPSDSGFYPVADRDETAMMHREQQRRGGGKK